MMNNYTKKGDVAQILFDSDNSINDCDLIPVKSKPTVPNSKKVFSHPVLVLDNSVEESGFDEKKFIAPDTLFSPKDKVSNYTWANKFPIDHDMGVITSRKNGTFGCVVQLNYENIINSDDVVTGAELSPFDRCVYDAVVTLHVAGNNSFTTNEIWNIISHHSGSRLTPSQRDKIIRSMFHISKFWMSIVTDDSKKYDTWFELNSDAPFNSERKLYKQLLTSYTGRLLDFCVIGKMTFDVSYEVDGKQIKGKESFAQVWQLLSSPILYRYAKAKSQVSSVPLYLLDTSKKPDKKHSLKRGSHNDELASFLAREIDTMKKTAQRKKSYSHIILLERLYQIDGIDNIQQNTNDLKKKRKRTRDKLSKILNRFKENGMIANYTFNKKTVGKSLTFHSVQIFF